MKESTIEKHLVKRVKELGGEVRKVKWIGRNGAPDRLVMLPDPGPGRGTFNNAWWVELKATGVPPEPHQLREHERMRKLGQRVVVIDSIEGVEGLLNRAHITRQDVLDAVRDHPGSTVDQIAEITGGTRLSVEQHLIRASGAGQVENRGGRGGNRVPGAWHLTAPVVLPHVNSVWALGVSP